MRIGIRLPPCRPVDEVAEAARRAEELGFDDVWVPDSQTLWRDAYATLACAALRTERVRLGTAVTNVVTRHPSVVAAAARTIAELAPGRFVLGVGVGNSSVEPVGLRSSTTAELRAGVTGLRDTLPGIPIHVAASGPRNLALGGELGDGVILLAGASAARVEEALTIVGRHGTSPEVTVSAFCHVTDDLERDAPALKPVCAAMAQKGGGAALAAAGIEVRVPRQVPEVRPDLLHAENWEHAVEVCSAWVSDADAVRFAEEFCLYSSVERIADRMAGLKRLGVTGVLLQHVGSYTLPHEVMESLGKVLA
ncbi:5,10-methylenetetrahydromethanopterin reductase [Actinoallomurus oryzae]|jgi:5,10-methylenetetrahydromethanopterin reductase|uniref:5,10-methylenetetrahydromethanopterin reductase n=1 Tax=Actinoallomurus oryzae TaxID=502180 RepID=A0ABP8PEL6_9ACTN